METTNETRWATLLTDAVITPGLISTAYSTFHGYSLGNQMAALGQCYGRGIEIGPISTYKGWQAVGRQVKKGEKAIELCMPVTRRKNEQDSDGTEREAAFTMFIYKRNWFVMSQTEGDDYQLPPMPAWDKARALKGLDVSEIPFDIADGNVQGFARGRSLAINPVAALPHKTLFHELGHIMLGHTHDHSTEKSLREAEAESVALLCLDSLELPGAEFCRGYIQNWLRGAPIPEKSAQKIFAAANKILAAGREETKTAKGEEAHAAAA